ncbi:MAG: CCA tRNA nucleotidyltransferase [Anaerolineales bacterium]|nr:CCA tRNA nucleotidyltransferase [Anaerolineales bacterium]
MSRPDFPENNQSSYAGRWIAKVGGTIVAQGGTREQALRAAKHSRPKENPVITFVPMNHPFLFPDTFFKTIDTLSESTEIYLVGGAVRDALVQRPIHDLDFVVNKNAIRVARKVAKALQGAFYNMSEEFGIGRVVLIQENGSREVLDFAPLQGDSLIEDLTKRDFTVNAMAVDAHHPEQLLDPLGGAADLLAKRLRVCSPGSFIDDPVRVLRAIRSAATFQLKMEPLTLKYLKEAVPRLMESSIERLRDEFFQILNAPSPARSLRAMEMLGILKVFLPELTKLKSIPPGTQRTWDGWSHTLAVIKNLEKITNVLNDPIIPSSNGDLIDGQISLHLGRYRKEITQYLGTSISIERDARQCLVFSGLYLNAKLINEIEETDHKQCAKVAQKRSLVLRLSNNEVERIVAAIQACPTVPLAAEIPEPLTPVEIYRFFKDTKSNGIAVVLLSLANLLATYHTNLSQDLFEAVLSNAKLLFEAWWDKHQELVSPPVLLSGKEVMIYTGLKPGPIVGEYLEAIREAQVEGQVKTKEEAIAFLGRNL